MARPDKDINNVRLNKYFYLWEFASPDTNTVKVHSDLVDKLYMLRMIIKRSITITSGYRTESHNLAVGGSLVSWHLEGRAADVVIANIGGSYMEKICQLIGFTEIIYYTNKGHWHLAVEDAQRNLDFKRGVK